LKRLQTERTLLTQMLSHEVLQQNGSAAQIEVTQLMVDESQPLVSLVPVVHVSWAQPQFSSVCPLQLSSRPFPQVSVGAAVWF